MIEVIKAFGFAAIGAAAVHISWLHAWKMYREGKREHNANRRDV